LALLVFATGIQAAQAATVDGTGAGQSAASFTQSSQLQGLTAVNAAQHDQGASVSLPAVTAPAAAQGRGGFDAAQFTPPSGSQAAPSGSSSTTAWIAAGSTAAVLLVGFATWALMRRRRQPSARASAAYCAQHPDDALCIAA
jgi:hypothetical protein